MGVHINAKPQDIAPTVLMPGDPLRAKFIAENFLEKAQCYNNVRGMLGYTGYYQDKKISVQGSGMGLPSFSIYAHELMQNFSVQKLIRVGSCGSFQDDVQIRDLIFAQAACSDSNFTQQFLPNVNFSPIAHFELLSKAVNIAKEKNTTYHVGNILSTDLFYHPDENQWKKWRDLGVLGAEMETTALYTLALKYQRQALSILTVSDHLQTGEVTSAQEREQTFHQMVEIALKI